MGELFVLSLYLCGSFLFAFLALAYSARISLCPVCIVESGQYKVELIITQLAIFQSHLLLIQ
jgi:hypothetical protein